VFTEDELAQARAVPVLKIAEDHDAKLKKSGRDHVGPCPACGGVDRFAVWPKENVWNCLFFFQAEDGIRDTAR
jgi:putative DNA primase/helicase